MSIDDEPHLYTVSFSHLLPRPSYDQLSFSGPYSWTNSAYVYPQIYINYLIYSAVRKLSWVLELSVLAIKESVTLSNPDRITTRNDSYFSNSKDFRQSIQVHIGTES